MTDTESRILELKSAGLRGVDIADAVGVSADKVYKTLRKHGERYHAPAGRREIQVTPAQRERIRQAREADLMDGIRMLAHEIVCYCAMCVEKTDLGPDEEKIARMIRDAL